MLPHLQRGGSQCRGASRTVKLSMHFASVLLYKYFATARHDTGVAALSHFVAK